jgi:hypothetical protein
LAGGVIIRATAFGHHSDRFVILRMLVHRITARFGARSTDTCFDAHMRAPSGHGAIEGWLLMSFIWGAGKNLTNGAVRFVTRRAALTLAALVACGSSALALTAGVMIGRDHPRRDAAAQTGDGRVARDYTIAELGKLNAAVEQMEPRLTRLATQVAQLHDFETRLKTIKTLPRPVFAPALAASDVLGDDAGDDVVERADKKTGARCTGAQPPAKGNGQSSSSSADDRKSHGVTLSEILKAPFKKFEA